MRISVFFLSLAREQKRRRQSSGREKISDSFLNGFRAESNRESKNGVRDVLEAVWASSGGYGQWRERQRRLQGDCEAVWNSL